MKNLASNRLLVASLAAVLLFPTPTLAQSGSSEIEALRQEVGALRVSEAAARARVDELEARLARLEAGKDPVLLRAEPIGTDEAMSLRGRYVVPQRALPSDPSMAFYAQASQQPAPSTSSGGFAPPAEEPTRKTPAPSEAVEEVSGQVQGRFGSRFGLDLGLGYSHFSNARINLDGFLALDAIFLGLISIDQVNADIMTIDPTLRTGYGNNVSFTADVPYLVRRSNFQSGGAGGNAGARVEKTVWDDGVGDVSISGNARLLRETARRPDIVANLRLKFPTGRHPYGVSLVEVANSEGNLKVPTSLSTGTGVYSLSGGFSALKTIDPLVVFGSVNYYHNFDRNFADIDEQDGDQPGRVRVGDSFQYGAGLAYALNDRSSISMSYTQRFTGHSKLRPLGEDWQTIVGSQSNIAMANLGATFALGKSISLITNVGIGLTNDSPDMSLSIRIPMQF